MFNSSGRSRNAIRACSLVVGLLVPLLQGGCPPPPGGGNSAPVADDLEVSVATDGQSTVSFSATDANGDALTFIILSLPAHGALTDPSGAVIPHGQHPLAAGVDEVVYTPDPGFAGEDSFTYAAFDGERDSDAATVAITVAAPQPTTTFDEDTTVASLTVPSGTLTRIADNAVVTVTGDTVIDGTLSAESGRIRLKVDGDLTINGRIQVVDTDAAAADDAPLTEQPTAILLVVGDDGAVTFGPNAVLNSTGPIVVTDDEGQLARTPADFYAEVENVGDDDLPTLVPLPPDDPAFDDDGPPKIKIQPQLQAAPPVTVTGTWPPVGAAPPPGDQPVIIFRFNGNRDLNLDNWTVNGPPAPARAPVDQTNNPGDNATGPAGRNGLNLYIWNNGGPINIVNNVVLNVPDGGAGATATTVCATATGGPGGKSGNFRMTAANGIDITNGTLTINPGRGGQGGDAFVDLGAAGAAGCPGETGRSGTGTAGKGGDNLKRLFARGNVTGLANVTIGTLSGGDGGLADVSACDGGPGLICCDGGPGGEATSMGGAGGNASLSVGALPVATGSVTGGFGGDAFAFGGFGGDGGDCKLDDAGDGGVGGDATATGGAGGTATSDGAGGATGGDGGDAIAQGGDGGNGGDSGLGDPGVGGAGGAGDATAGAGGAAATSGSEGESTPADGGPGEDGGVLAVILYCFGFDFLGDGSGPVEPGVIEGPVLDTDNTTQIGTLAVDFVDGAGAIYARSDNPVPHIGIDGGRLRIDVSSLQLEIPPDGIVSGLQIAPLFGQNINQQRPLVVEALDANGEIIGTQAFTSVPDNSANTDEPQALNAEFDVAESVAAFEIVVPAGSFVTIIRFYLVDP